VGLCRWLRSYLHAAASAKLPVPSALLASDASCSSRTHRQQKRQRQDPSSSMCHLADPDHPRDDGGSSLLTCHLPSLLPSFLYYSATCSFTATGASIVHLLASPTPMSDPAYLCVLLRLTSEHRSTKLFSGVVVCMLFRDWIYLDFLHVLLGCGFTLGSFFRLWFYR
jgi:hypothetical protein